MFFTLAEWRHPLGCPGPLNILKPWQLWNDIKHQAGWQEVAQAAAWHPAGGYSRSTPIESGWNKSRYTIYNIQHIDITMIITANDMICLFWLHLVLARGCSAKKVYMHPLGERCPNVCHLQLQLFVIALLCDRIMLSPMRPALRGFHLTYPQPRRAYGRENADHLIWEYSTAPSVFLNKSSAIKVPIFLHHASHLLLFLFMRILWHWLRLFIDAFCYTCGAVCLSWS